MKTLFSKGRQRSVMLVSFLILAVAAFAVPAKPGLKRVITLADGTTVNAMLVGDEYGHFWKGTDGKSYQAVAGTDVFQEVNSQVVVEKAQQRRAQANKRRTRRLAPRRVGDVGAITGQKKGLIILVDFSDVSFQDGNNKALYLDIANKVNFSQGNFKGSMYDYFYAQSEGKFELTFDVVGPVKVSQTQSYYGNNVNGSDEHAAEMVIEALQLADSQVNYANYDWDGDLEVEQVYVVYAGKGEADGGAANTIWPHEYDLYSANYYGDGSGPQSLDGVKINTYACGGELNGSDNIAGIGTMCHEFSHCLGYPDYYDTDYSGGQGMFDWDLMDSGSYNGGGYRPAGYTSYERWVAGWKEPVELVYTQDISNMKALQDKDSETFVIYNKGNRNEYYLLENRQKTKWDTDIPGSGLLILHVDYDADVWFQNKPNDDPSHQRMTWIPADNQYQNQILNGSKYYTTEGAANDPFPYGSVNAFGKNTTPAATLYNEDTDGTYYIDSSVKSITQNSDGTISFSFIGASNPDTKFFKLVTSTDDLEPGMRYIIACGSKATAAGALNSSYLSKKSVTVTNDVITIGNDVAVFVLEEKDGGWSFLNESTNKYLQCTAAKSVSYSSSEYAWTLSNGTAGVIMKAGSNGTMLYNANDPRFTTYTSDPNASMIQANLYMETNTEPKKDVTMSFEPTEATATIGKAFTEPTLTTNPADLTVTYSSSEPTVATVDENTGEVTLLAAGETIITATFAGNSSYNEGSASYTLTVKAPPVVGSYELVTDASTLAAGDKILITYIKGNDKYVLSTTQNTNNRAASTDVTLNDDGTLTPGDEAQIITLEKDGDNFLFNVGDGYLYAASSDKNYLLTEETADANAKAAITVNNSGDATIVFQGTNTRKYLRFNPNTTNNNPLFSCYAKGSTTGSLPQIYREVPPIKGDANGDGGVTITDAVAIVNYILGNPSADFNKAAANVNNDYDDDGNPNITITDAVGVVNIILNSGAASAPKMEAPDVEADDEEAVKPE